MPANRHALIRYQVLDECLRNRARRWTLDDLIEKVSQVLYEYEGTRQAISRRTIQADLQAMRSEKLGYNAPIEVVGGKYYTYADPDFSLGKRPVSPADLERLRQAMGVLRQFSGFSQFDQLAHMVQKLEGHIQASTQAGGPWVDFERNDQLHGLRHLSPLYEAIAHGQAVCLAYQSFVARKQRDFDFHPWWLKEFKNRWFVIGRRQKESATLTLALDRIHSLAPAVDCPYCPAPEGLTPATYYQHVVGVTVSDVLKPVRICLEVAPEQVPYLLTKPIHASQKSLGRQPGGALRLELHVQINLELQRELLGYGEAIQVLAPSGLRATMQQRLRTAAAQYALPAHPGMDGLEAETALGIPQPPGS